MSQGENDLQYLTSTIAGKISEGVRKTESFSSACIYRVPKDLRKLKKSAYTPRFIAIGPLHRNDKHLQTPLQLVKMRYTNYLLSRLTDGMEDPALAKQTVLQNCLAEMKTSIDDAKQYYAEEVTLDEEMLLIDGCFILEFLYRYHSSKSKPQETDPICGNSLIATKVVTDLILLENQIPFFVLEKLFKLTVEKIPHQNWRPITDYVKHSYDRWLSPIRKSDNSDRVLKVIGCTTAAEEEVVQSGNIDDRSRTSKYYHILHSLHDSYLPHDHDQTKNETFRLTEMPSASELVYAGVKFVPDAGNDLFKFEFTEPKGLFRWFHRARFVIPPLVIYDSTESLLRNLIALEQSCPGVPQHVSSYATVLDMLVSTDKDVQVLEKAGVLTNWLGATKDATNLFNKLCKEIKLGRYFDDTRMKATEYSKRFWPKNMAHVRRTYFDSPWTFMAFCVGFMAFVISLVEFVHDFAKKG